MHNYYLLNESYKKITIETLQQNLILLNSLIRKKRVSETFYFDSSLYSFETDIGIFTDLIFNQLPNKQFQQKVLPKLLQQDLKAAAKYCKNEQELDTLFVENINGFYGIDFSELEIAEHRCCTTPETYRNLKYDFSLLEGDVFWGNKQKLFDRIEFCDSIEDNKKYFLGLPNQDAVIDKLTRLEMYCLDCWNGSFDFDDFKEKTGINFSPESQSTLNQFSKERTFRLPDGENHVFSWHIKVGDTRIYFYPKNDVIYIPYIGTHLPTKKFR